MQIERDLYGAWDRGEMRVHYQPIVDVADQEVVGVEALLRWCHPRLGNVPAEVAIEVAQRQGLMDPLGTWVLHEVCNEMACRHSEGGAGRDLFASVNVSPSQLQNFPKILRRALDESGLRPGKLHLELTESTEIRDERRAASQLACAREMGVEVWLDDFGTGFSRLSHLHQLSLDGIKIDRSFVAILRHDPYYLALTAAIVSMAHSLDLLVVAEGVETQDQLDLLRHCHCDLAQGHWLGYPVNASDLVRLLDEGRARARV